MSHTYKAAVVSIFAYVQFGLAMVSGIVLFPLVIKSVGVYAFGLWLATGEAISYVLLGDLGVFAVLPWLIAGRLGANDIDTLRQYMSNSIAIGSALAFMILVASLVLFLIDPAILGVSQTFWNQILYPTALLLILYGVSYPLRAFNALLAGVQDVYFTGGLAVFQSVWLIGLTICVIQFQTGMTGLALATGLPPLMGSLLAWMRVGWRHTHLLRGMGRPNLVECQALLREGFRAWVSGFGYRLMAASNGIILLVVGRPDLGTVYASTGKIAQILASLCSTLPDSGLVGVSHIFATNNRERSRQTVVCLILLYLLLPSLAAVGLLIANAAFVAWWISPNVYAGHYVNTLVAITLVVSGIAGGSVKLAAIVACRQVVGWTTLVAGVLYTGLGLCMVHVRGLAGLAETALLIWSVIILPVGGYLIARVYDVHVVHLFRQGLGRWITRSVPAFLLSIWLGCQLTDSPMTAFVLGAVGVLLYAFSLRGILEQAPWPGHIRALLDRFAFSSFPR